MTKIFIIIFSILFVCTFFNSCSYDGDDSILPGSTETIPVISFNLKYCPGGTFPTGTFDTGTSATEDAFWIGETEVTYQVWSVVYTWAIEPARGANRYTFGNTGTIGDGSGDNIDHPVTLINWRDAMIWCNALSEMLGKSPVYKNGVTVVRNSSDGNGAQCDGVTADPSADGYRLPESMEWECAARYRNGSAWTPGNYASGASAPHTDESATDAVAWFEANSSSSTHAEKVKSANALGIFDMSGNVTEWCFTLGSGGRVIRGGDWHYASDYLQIGYEDSLSSGVEYNTIGFRVARSAD